MPINDDRGDLREDEIISELVTRPKETPRVKMFVGLLGKSPKKGYWRIYVSLDVKDYFEVRDGDIVLVKSLKTPENPLGGSAIWIMADANIEVTRPKTSEKGVELLSGNITARFLKGAAPSITGTVGWVLSGGIKSIPPVESCVPALCLPPPPEPGDTAVCTLATDCRTEFLCF